VQLYSCRHTHFSESSPTFQLLQPKTFFFLSAFHTGSMLSSYPSSTTTDPNRPSPRNQSRTFPPSHRNPQPTLTYPHQILGGYVFDAFLSPWTLLIKALGLALAVASGLSLGKEVHATSPPSYSMLTNGMLNCYRVHLSMSRAVWHFSSPAFSSNSVITKVHPNTFVNLPFKCINRCSSETKTLSRRRCGWRICRIRFPTWRSPLRPGG
jgi:hypothetical protein